MIAQDYTWPTDAGTMYSSNFGEYRDNHFHMGIDIKTSEQEGASVIAISDGYVSRMVANYTGFGKALYLTTSDGKTAVYAHLSQFTPLLEAVSRKVQKEKKSYIVNEYFNPSDFRVKKGDVIGQTGNTGASFGPHLHFELRNDKEQPINPLTHGFIVQDRIPPIFREVAIIPLSADTWINGARLPQSFPLLKNKGGIFRFPDTLNCLGKIGLAVNVVDKREGSNNEYQLQKIELWVDDENYYTLQFDTLDYSQGKKVHTVRDYSFDRLNLGEYSKLYRLNSYSDVTVAKNQNGRPLHITPGFHRIEIKGFDSSGNMSKVVGTIFGNPPFDMKISDVMLHQSEIQFTVQPKKILVPIKEVIAYSFTSYGFADQRINILNQTSSKDGILLTLPKKEIKRKAIQFIGINKLGAYSKPIHWNGEILDASAFETKIDLDISHSEAGVFIQVETKQVIEAKLALAINQGSSLVPISLEQTHPNVYLTKMLDPNLFNGIKGINVTVSDKTQRDIRFAIQPQVVVEGNPTTILSQDNQCSIRTKNKSTYFPTVMWIETIDNPVEVVGGVRLSNVYQLQPFEIPLKDSIHVGIRFGEKIKGKDHIDLYYYDKDDGWTFVNNVVSKKRKVITGSITSLEAIAIIQDEIPPKLVDSFPGNGGKYKSYFVEKIRVSFQDKLSDIDPSETSMSLALDGEQIRFAYQPILQELAYYLDEPLSLGSHSIVVSCSDKAGNKTEETLNFIID